MPTIKTEKVQAPDILIGNRFFQVEFEHISCPEMDMTPYTKVNFTPLYSEKELTLREFLQYLLQKGASDQVYVRKDTSTTYKFTWECVDGQVTTDRADWAWGKVVAEVVMEDIGKCYRWDVIVKNVSHV